jgi:histidyl-tRNA synthetase
MLPEQMAIKDCALATIRSTFKVHGAVEIDTPVFERKDVLLDKYGEESKLIYDLADQGGELLSLRYDLTVPLARYMATHNFSKLKRFHIGKVYRRDDPSIATGRFREFTQCDFDIAGPSSPMVADAEILKTFVETLKNLDIEFKIKINDRRFLDLAITKKAGVKKELFNTVCSSIDKLDKLPWK